jgi:ferrous iron transport protein B
VSPTESPRSDSHHRLSPPRAVALVGNPNCGKTTLFNSLTGSNYKVANYPGVTVEKRMGTVSLPNSHQIQLIDLPGTYALQGSTLDEQIVTQFLRGEIQGAEKPDLVVAVIDATNLERNLYLISELIDSGFALVVALNMMDAAEEKGIKVYSELLARAIDLPVIPIVARSKKGLDDLKSAIAQEMQHPKTSKKSFAWLPADHVLASRIKDAFSLHPVEHPEPELITTAGALRYAWIRSITARCTQQSERTPSQTTRLDAILTSKVWGLPIFGVIFACIFQAIFTWAQLPMDLISSAVDALSAQISATLPPGIFTSLLAEGIVPGVGNVIVFVPQIAILFFCLGILEDSGYLARAAFLLDNFMRKVGLQGRAFVPLLSSFACAVPGILATRTIPSRFDRLTTIMIAPLMGCSARLPVYAVLIGAAVPSLFIGGFISLQGLVLLGMYALGIVGACCIAWLVQKLFKRKDSCFFVLEMPPLRRPVLPVVFRNVYDAVLSFLKNASTVILACSIVVWFLATFPKPEAGYQGNPVEVSYAGRMGKAIEPAIKPLGFNWEIGFGIISSFPAREVFVSSLSTVLHVSDTDQEDHRSLIQRLQEKRADGSFSTYTAISLMVFYVFACQCMSTLAVCKRETGSWRWVFVMFGYMTTLAYIASFVTYQIGIRLF